MFAHFQASPLCQLASCQARLLVKHLLLKHCHEWLLTVEQLRLPADHLQHPGCHQTDGKDSMPQKDSAGLQAGAEHPAGIAAVVPAAAAAAAPGLREALYGKLGRCCAAARHCQLNSTTVL